jgi:hypothetical protein
MAPRQIARLMIQCRPGWKPFQVAHRWTRPTFSVLIGPGRGIVAASAPKRSK